MGLDGVADSANRRTNMMVLVFGCGFGESHNRLGFGGVHGETEEEDSEVESAGDSLMISNSIVYNK